jgi:anti-anti-sigma regulatory factor
MRSMPDIPRLEIETTGRTDGVVWIHLRGGTDMSTHGQLVAGLAAVDLDGVKVLHVDLSDLHFCDVRGLHHILIFARVVKRNGDVVVVHGASRMMLKMIDVLGVGTTNSSSPPDGVQLNWPA